MRNWDRLRTLALDLAARPEGMISREIVEQLDLKNHRTANSYFARMVKAGELKRQKWSCGRGGPRWVYHVSDPQAAIDCREKRDKLLWRLKERSDGSDDRLAELLPQIIELTDLSIVGAAKELGVPESWIESAVYAHKAKPERYCDPDQGGCGWRGRSPTRCESWDSGKPEVYYRCRNPQCGMIVS